VISAGNIPLAVCALLALRLAGGCDGSFGELSTIIDDLPDGGQHLYRTLGIGPAETNPEHATLLQSSLDGATRQVFANGLRNTIGFAWSELPKMKRQHSSDLRRPERLS
jgi:glucose/arabinose dehydrogenase